MQIPNEFYTMLNENTNFAEVRFHIKEFQKV
ncbi:hypothetical protein HH_0556 [Helicobacter hepaticus ATCC 51449]|uniref:Uncharacterized protein n=1 Tax=Helicobacter hepaticus (strain ATCC 51449 / 3B1) TaxID=235279 RepID=Q7VIP8_HELHP|nr:hypothetical protein HH_0556 [Helicobacter hepaticus ATCC 51449]